MIEILKTEITGQELVRIDSIEKGCWINLVNPSDEELNFVQEKLNILPNFLRDPLDEEEKPRIDLEENQTLIIIDVPLVYEKDKNLKFGTIPLGILVLDSYFVTVSLEENYVIEQFRTNKVRGFYTFKKTRFTFQLLFRISKDYLRFLRHIDKKTDDAEKLLRKSMKNKELFKLLELEKSLVFFTTSLKSNEIVMEKLLSGRYLKMYEEDQDLLEDVIIENKQALEMANIYSSILSGMMDAFASVISNNLNMVMKFLTSVTIVMAIPTMIASFYGMNGVALPLQGNPFALLFIIIFTIAASMGAIFLLFRKKMF